MMKLNKTFGDFSQQQFSEQVDDFLSQANEAKSIDCIDQGIKTLSIMYVSLDEKDQQSALEQFKKAIEYQVNFEIAHCKECKYNIDSIDTRSEISINLAMSHELIL